MVNMETYAFDYGVMSVGICTHTPPRRGYRMHMVLDRVE